MTDSGSDLLERMRVRDPVVVGMPRLIQSLAAGPLLRRRPQS